LDDLDEAAEYISKGSKYYAAAFVREIKDAAKSLKTFAKRGRMVPEFGQDSIREVIVQSYRLIYQVEGEVVNILAVVHGARDLWVLWDKEARGESAEDTQ